MSVCCTLRTSIDLGGPQDLLGGSPGGSLPARFKADPGPEGGPEEVPRTFWGDPPREARRPVTMVILGSVEETVGETVGGLRARFKGDSAQKNDSLYHLRTFVKRSRPPSSGAHESLSSSPHDRVPK